MKRMQPDRRRKHILESAMIAARYHGYKHVTRSQVAEIASITEGLIHNYYGSIDVLRAAVLDCAIESKDMAIIAQCLVYGDDDINKIPENLIAETIDYIRENHGKDTKGV